MKQHSQKLLSLLLCLAMVLSVFAGMGAPAAAADVTAEDVSQGKASSSFEPWGHGYRMVDILNFDPATDPYSQELVASVPLQERNATFAATQANKDLSDDSKLYVISSGNYRSTDVNEAPWNAGMSYDDFSYNLFKFWQYADMVGAGGRPTQNIAIGSADKEYGIIAVPMAAATNAAHKNGVITLAEYFIPRTPQYTEEWLYQAEDGSFPYAQKLVDLAKYYGFDGYFINQEASIDSSYVPLFREMLKYMREQGIYIQWYDSATESGGVSYQNAFNSNNSGWIWNETQGHVAHSIFLNYWYSSTALKNSKQHAIDLGLDPYEVVFMGVEGGQWEFGTDIETRYNAVDENGKPYTSFAIWGSDWYHEQFHKPNGRYEVGYQWEAEERERIYYTSATENAGEYSTGTVKRNDIGYDKTINFQGFSKYVVEKSVINGTAFASDFNNGHGMQYYRNGQVSRDMEWTNLNLQDILPTWQWWVQSADENRLELDWDYGPKFFRYVNGEEDHFNYTQIGAYNGGSSLAMHGALAGSQTVNLYKTKLDVTADSSISLTYNKPSADDTSKAQIALIFEEDPTQTVYLPIENSGKKTEGWTTATVSLGAYAGKTIAAIALELSATELVENYQLNLGRLVVSDGQSHTPAAPTGLKLVNRFDGTNEIQLAWDLGDYDTVKNYHVYAVYADGTERFVGGAYAANYYIQTLENAESVTALRVRAVGVDGSESAAAELPLASTGRVSNVRTVSENNMLNVTWTDPAENFAKVEATLTYWYSETTNENQTITVNQGDQKASFPIELEDGAQYILTLTTVSADATKNETVSYFSDLTDKYCAPYDGEGRVNPSGRINLTTPAVDDWNLAYVEVDGNTTTYRRFGGSSMANLSVKKDGLTLMVITLEDMDGNKSQPVTLMFLNGQPATADMAYGEEMIPDPVLRAALQEKVGPTVADLIGFTGDLDLSGRAIEDLTGLNLLTGLTGVNLSGSALTKITADKLPNALTTLDLTGCADLVEVKLDNRPELAVILKGCAALTDLSLENYGDHALDLSDCVNLLNLNLAGTQMTALNIQSLIKLHNFDLSDSQIAELKAAKADRYTNGYNWSWQSAKLDLTEGTSEGQLMAGVQNYFATAEIPDELAKESSQLARGTLSSWSGNSTTLNLGNVSALDTVVVESYYPQWYGTLSAFTVEISTDGATYTQVAEYTDLTEAVTTVQLPEGTRAAHVKITVPEGTSAYVYVTVNGFLIAPKGFAYDGQQPAMERDEIAAPTVKDNRTVYQVLDLLNEQYASTRLVKSGTLGSDLVNADWMDQDYLSKQITAPTGVKVEITDPEGNPYVIPVEGPTLGDIDRDNKLAVQNILASGGNNGEGPEMMFDGIENSKWCTSGHTGWAGFELEAPAVIGEWYTLHAGNESRDAITRDFRLQYLNPEVLAEADYMAMSDSEKRNVLRNSANWLDLDVVTGNTDNEVTREINLDNLATAQVYRLYVDESQQADFWGWNIRILELQMFAYTGQLGANTNGLLEADAVGEYQIHYVKAKESIAATTFNVEHDILSWELTKEATCTEEGEMKRVCANCGLEETITLAALGHKYGEGAVTKEATCTSEGEMTFTCSVCGEIHTEATPKKDHTYTSVVTDPTCVDAGYTTHTCSVCGHSYVDTLVKAKGHSYVDTVTAPTCDAMGYTTHTCSVCGDSYVDSIVEATGHHYVDTVTAPTCDAMGYTTHTCSVCGDSYVDTFVPATDHDYEQTVTKEATCTEEGEMTFTCKHQGCGKTYTMPIPKTEHDCEATVVEATCLGYGYTLYECKHCEYSYIADLVQPHGHSYDAVVTAPTADEGGYTTHTCVHCGHSYVDELTEALGHKCAAFTDIAGHWAKDAICFVTEQGLFQGVTNTTFAPERKMDRAMVVTVLYRLAGSPAVTGETTFQDVDQEGYYYDALLWAAQNQIVLGMTDTTFAPKASVTREQLVTFLYRYAKFAGLDSVSADLSGYVDANRISPYAQEAFSWAVAAGLVKGTSNNTLAPTASATRAQFATILTRLINAD